MYQQVEILENKEVTRDLYHLKLKGCYDIKAGQFFMLKKEQSNMTLFRPISIFDVDEEGIHFLYLVKGSGTKVLSQTKVGEILSIHGPYGNGFPSVDTKAWWCGLVEESEWLRYICVQNTIPMPSYISV